MYLLRPAHTHTVFIDSSRTNRHKTKRKISKPTYRLDVTMQESHRVNGFYRFQNLFAQSQRCAQCESPSRLTPSEICKISALKQSIEHLNHHSKAEPFTAVNSNMQPQKSRHTAQRGAHLMCALFLV